MTDLNLPVISNLPAVPAYLIRGGSALSQALVVAVTAPPKISIRGSKWIFIRDGAEQVYRGETLSVVILAADPPTPKSVSRAYYPGAYVPGVDSPPSCFSEDGIAPDARAQSPQAPTCASCQRNIWGSRKSQSGGNAKECRDSKTLYVVAPNAVASGTVYALRLPPTSFKSLSEYTRKLMDHGVALVEGVVTSLSFADTEHPQIEFSFGAFLPEVAAREAIARAASEEVQSLLHYPPTSVPPVLIPPTNPTDSVGGRAATLPPLVREVSEPLPQAPIAAAPLPPPHQPGSDVWPSPPLQAPIAAAPSSRIDSAGVAYDPAIHATSAQGGPSFLSDGTFRARRGVGKTSVPPPANNPPMDQGDELDKILKDWS